MRRTTRNGVSRRKPSEQLTISFQRQVATRDPFLAQLAELCRTRRTAAKWSSCLPTPWAIRWASGWRSRVRTGRTCVSSRPWTSPCRWPRRFWSSVRSIPPPTSWARRSSCAPAGVTRLHTAVLPLSPFFNAMPMPAPQCRGELDTQRTGRTLGVVPKP